MSAKMRPFLMFQGGVAEEAMRLYLSILGGAEVDVSRRPDGTLLKATFTIAGQEVLCSDSPIKHDFGFTPALSLFVECASDAEVDRLAAALGEGRELMPPGDYGFSRRFAWVNDRFGVSWQLNFP